MKEYKQEIEIVKLVREKTGLPSAKITSAADVVEIARKIYEFNDEIGVCESFYAFYLNKANRLTCVRKVSKGGTDSTVVDVKIVVKVAIELLSASVIVLHNHPSGNLTPSGADKEITKRLVKAFDFFCITVLDSIILTEESFYSMAEEFGTLENVI